MKTVRTENQRSSPPRPPSTQDMSTPRSLPTCALEISAVAASSILKLTGIQPLPRSQLSTYTIHTSTFSSRPADLYFVCVYAWFDSVFVVYMLLFLFGDPCPHFLSGGISVQSHLGYVYLVTTVGCLRDQPANVQSLTNFSGNQSFRVNSRDWVNP